MAESVMGILKTAPHRTPAILADNGRHWKGPDDLAAVTCAWVSWFNEQRLHGELGDHTPTEVEAEFSDADLTNAA
jgi:transposase InsO family protein